MILRKLFKTAPEAFRLPEGRVYAIGDVHGCLNCLDTLLANIAKDHVARGVEVPMELVLLGDLIDRGPQSREVVERAIGLAREVAPTTILMGNHEELLLGARAGERNALAVFDRAGGRETMLSYGVDPADYDACTLAELANLIERAVPTHHVAFLTELADRVVRGDYVFVHAGIRPGVALDQQSPKDLRWIREPFLSHKGSYGAVVVHGHTITNVPEVRSNRIGIDTGAYSTGTLTALALEGDQRWFLSS